MRATLSAAIGILVIIVIVGAVYATRSHQAAAPTPNGGAVCTLEAKICPDGSAVGRTGPNCEFAACPGATESQGILPYRSGVKGTVMLGPNCPVMRNPPDPQCADRPYATMVAVFRKSDATHAFAIGKSDANGAFQFSLPPGDYVLGAGESNLPRCDHPAVTVGPSGYATTTISCDTGIR